MSAPATNAPAFTLRPYQKDAATAMLRYIHRKPGNPLVELPTGTGKSIVIAAVIKKLRELYPYKRIAMVTHVKELIQQNWNKLRALLPDESIGIYSAGLGRRDAKGWPVVCMGIQSVFRKAEVVGPFDVLVVDEAHLASAKSEGMYREFIDDLKLARPKLKVLGFTATPFRTASGYLTQGETALFRSVCYKAKTSDMIEQGYLSPIVTRPASNEIDTADVKKRAGEFITKDIEKALDLFNTPAAIDELCELGAVRKSWLVFCVSVPHADEVLGLIRQRGFAAGIVTGKTPPATRHNLLEQFKAGELRALVNVNVLTTGFDAPATDLVALLRPTASPGLYVQMVGRGLRLAEGKADCLLLDYGGNIDRHGPLDDIRPREAKGTGGEAPVKMCDQCALEVHAAVRVCPDCGFLFPAPEADTASRTAATSKNVVAFKPERFIVDDVAYSVHHPGHKTHATLRVDYLSKTGMPMASEFVALDHDGFARKKAETWWRRRDPSRGSVPDTVRSALMMTSTLRKPSAIDVVQEKFNRKYYPKVTGYVFPSENWGGKGTKK